MKITTVKRHARALRRTCERATYASMVPDALPHDPVKVGDLPEFVFIRIGAWSQAGDLVDSLRAWIEQERAAE